MLKQILSLAGKAVAGLRVDLRTRYSNGEVMHPEQHRDPVIGTIKSIRIQREKGHLWLYWHWEPPAGLEFNCGFSGVQMNGETGKCVGDYHLEFLDPPPG